MNDVISSLCESAPNSKIVKYFP